MLEPLGTFSDEPFARALERYLQGTLYDSIQANELQASETLPIFLKRSYRFYESLIYGRRCIFAFTDQDTPTPSDIAKHIALARSALNAIVVFAASSLSAHNRSRLISQRIPFVVPGNQLYIPELAMDLREHFRAHKSRPVDGLSPVAQAVLFHHLLRRDESATTPSGLSVRLRYSAMSIGRAFDDLAAVGLAKTERFGKERHLQFNADRRTILEAARTLLRNPARGVKHIRNAPPNMNLKRAGESALADLTDLSRPPRDTYAVVAGNWNAIAGSFNLIEANKSEADISIETWSYDPAGLSDEPVVDPLSLYAQFWDHPDERVSMAAQELLEKFPW